MEDVERSYLASVNFQFFLSCIAIPMIVNVLKADAMIFQFFLSCIRKKHRKLSFQISR